MSNLNFFNNGMLFFQQNIRYLFFLSVGVEYLNDGILFQKLVDL
jgi:hypothetical protein